MTKPASRRVAVLAACILMPLASPADQFSIVYTADAWRNMSGGLDEGSAWVDNLDVIYEADLAEDFGFAKGSLYLHALYNNGGTFSDRYVGDLQGASNIEAPEALRLFQIFYEYHEDNWSLLTGLYDLNSEFDSNTVGSFFLNGSHGIGAEIAQTGENGPGIFPVSAFSLRYQYRADRMAIRAAVLDGVPGDPDDATSNRISLGGDQGFLTIAEVDYLTSEDLRLWSGYWRYTKKRDIPFEGVDGAAEIGDGIYVGAEKTWYGGGLAHGAFVRYGVADADLYYFDSYVGLGYVVGPPQDSNGKSGKFGIAMAAARSGDSYRTFFAQNGREAADWEVSLELSYRIQATEWLALQPDLQIVLNPAADTAIDDAYLFGLRFELDLVSLLAHR